MIALGSLEKYNYMRFLFLPICFILTFFPIDPGNCQEVTADQFSSADDAVQISDECYQLTFDYEWSSGSIWFKTPIDMTAPFEMELELFFGCKDVEGADGIVFVFHPNFLASGRRGEGMGFGGLFPALGIEFDTWENDHLGDPAEDHIALLKHGSVRHSSNLKGPIKIPNVENCRNNIVLVKWDPIEQNLTTSINGTKYLDYRGDIIKNVFFGDAKVYWGVTAATGGYKNIHRICLKKITFEESFDDLTFDLLMERHFLSGKPLPLVNMNFENQGENLSRSALPDLYRLSNLLKENPDMSIEIEGHAFDSNDSNKNKQLSEQRAKEIADFLKRKGISDKRIKYQGHGDKFPIQKGVKSLNSKKNTRIEIRIFDPRV